MTTQTDSRHSFAGERRADVQGLRAIAVLAVVVFHAGLPVPGGFVGVDIFFVISGFVITGMLRREWEATGQIGFGRFYVRRFKRLIPALALMVTVTAVVSALVLSPAGTQQAAAKTAIGAMLFAANLAIASTTGGYFDAPAHANPLLNTWSLSVEEQFYLAFPVLLFVSWRVARGNRALRHSPSLMVSVIAVVSLGLAVFGSADGGASKSSWLLGFYSPMTRAWEFAVGALLALAKPRVNSPAVASTAAFTGLALTLASLWLISDKTPFPSLWTLLPVVGTALLIAAGAGSSNPVTRALSTQPMVLVGDWSYSIYLWHWPLIVFSGVLWPEQSWLLAPLSAILSLALAIASYYWVEQPMRALPSPSAFNFARLATSVILIPLAAGLGLGVAARNWYGNDSLRQEMTAADSYPIGWGTPECLSRIPVGKRDVSPCQWSIGASGSPVYLIGDSNAVHFSEAAIAAAAALERPVTVLGGEGCPLADVYLMRAGDPSLLSRCRDGYLAVMNWLKQQAPGRVLVASVDRYWRDSDYLVSRTASFGTTGASLNAQLMDEGLTATVRDLQAAGHAVTLMQTIPHFTSESAVGRTACFGWEVIVGSCRPPSASMPLDLANDRQRGSRDGIRRVARETEARVFDLRGYFCPNDVCSTQHKSGIRQYMFDGYHLNKRGSALLKDEFVAELSESDLAAIREGEWGR